MVSICVLNWNRVHEVKMTVDVVKRVKIPWELIIFDQGSTDGSVEFLNSVKSDNIIPILSPTNIGNSLSRNQLVEKSKYEYVVFLDGDIVPIENSIEELVKFMVNNPKYAVLGYDFSSCTTELENTTPVESGIDEKDILENHHRIAFTQYGIFKKSALVKCPFPSFYPFNQEGWGAEDDLVGVAISDNKLGSIGTITGRTYFHNHPKSSWDLLGREKAQFYYALRFIYYRYYGWFLTPEEKQKALQTGVLPIKKVDLFKYHWHFQDNLGDIGTDYIFKKLFPFIKFNEDSENLFFFGGSIFNHLGAAQSTRKHKKFKRVEMFGVGIAREDEAINKPYLPYRIFPRGRKTYDFLKTKNYETDEPVGDVINLFTLLYKDRLPKGNGKTLYVRDSYDDTVKIPEGEKGIKVAKNAFSDSFPEEFVSIDEFIALCEEYSYIVSSQIHPFLIGIVLGKPGKLIPKDMRADDLAHQESFKISMEETDLVYHRIRVLEKLPHMIDRLMQVLAEYKM